MELIDLGMWTAGAIIVIGMIEFIKRIYPKLPSWVWLVATPLASGLTAFAGKSDKPIWDALGILSISTLCYQLVIKSLK